MKKNCQWIGMLFIAAPALLYCVPGKAQEHAAKPVESSAISAAIGFHNAGRTIPESYLGFSIEWPLVNQLFTPRYGRQATMIGLIKLLARYNGPPLLRIGGNSQDESTYNLPRNHSLPKFVHVNITNNMLRLLARVSARTGCKYVIGLNLGDNRPDLAIKLVQACRRIIGNRHIAGYEIGNEPDFFHRFGGIWQHNTLALYLKRWTRYYNAIRPYLANGQQIEGPAFGGGWLRDIPRFIALEHRRLGIVSLHRYPTGATVKNPRSPVFCSIANLLKNASATSFAHLMLPSLAAAKPYHIPVRYGEMNSAWNGGKLGVSNTFASALWGADTLFEIAYVGGAGVNIHLSEGFDQFPGNYDPVYFHPHQPLRVRPLFYGMLAFARTIQNRAQLIPVTYHTHLNVKIWAARAADGMVRIAIINKSSHPTKVRLNFPAGKHLRHYTLTAPSISAEYGVKLDGLTFDGGKNGRLVGKPSFVRQVHASAPLVVKPYSISVVVMPPSAARLFGVPSLSGTPSSPLLVEHRMINPVVDPVPRTDHRVITTVLYDATMPQEAKNRPGAPGSQPGDYSDRLLRRVHSVPPYRFEAVGFCSGSARLLDTRWLDGTAAKWL